MCQRYADLTYQGEAFIFDMDGTLVDNARYHTQAWLDLLTELGVRVVPDDFHHWSGGKTNGQILREVLGPELPEECLREYATRKELLYRSAYGPHLRLIKGLDGFLEAAERHGIRMALATSADRTNIDFVIGGLGIGRYFQAIVSSEEITHGKPDPEAFLLAAERLRMTPGRCLVFEDSLGGIEAAYRAGMKAIAVATSVEPQAFCGAPGVLHVVRDFSGLHPTSLPGWVASG